MAGILEQRFIQLFISAFVIFFFFSFQLQSNVDAGGQDVAGNHERFTDNLTPVSFLFKYPGYFIVAPLPPRPTGDFTLCSPYNHFI